MPTPKIINKFGTLIGWNQVTPNVLGREVEGITEVEYGDEQDVAPAYGAGNYPIGEEVKNYKANASVTMYIEELIALQQQLPKGGRLSDLVFDIPVQYEYNGSFYKDIIRNFRPTKNPRSIKQGDGKILSKIEGYTSHIDWNV